jgi:glycosyltransferase involved in cell wall biosynthesis
MNQREVFFVGPPYRHYAAHSGYETIARHCGRWLNSPVQNRYMFGRLGYYRGIGNLGWRLDQVAMTMVGSRLYGMGIPLIELAAGLHMAAHRQALYHVLYGETDTWLLRYFRRISTSRLVATFHEPIPRLESLDIGKIVPFLDAATPVSNYQRGFFERFLPRRRVLVVPHGIDVDFFQPPAMLSDEPVCITVGSTLRDFDTLKKAISIIHETNPQVRFVAVGTNLTGGNKSQLHDDRVEILTSLNDVGLLTAYHRSRVAVLSFEQATANNALLEAMACGLPTVATDIGGVREYLGEDAGILCPPRDAAAFADAVLRILGDRALADRMSRAARTRSLLYDYRRVAQQMSDVHAQVFRNGSRD